MKTLEELQAYYEANMQHRLEELEKERRRYLPRVRWFTGWLFGAWAVAMVVAVAMGMEVWSLWRTMWPAHVVFAVAWIVVGSRRTYVFQTRGGEIAKRCKDELIVPMLRWLVPELDYDPHGAVATERVLQSQLIRSHDRLECEDRFHGRLGQTDLEFCELRVHYHTTRETRNGGTETTHHIDPGLYLVASANKPFSGQTRLYPDRLERFLGDAATRMLSVKRFGKRQGTQKSGDASSTTETVTRDGLHLIHMEHAAFEQRFKVYTTDDVEAHYILTPSLMERLAEYRDSAGQEVHMNFRDAHLYAWFPFPLFTLRPPDLFDVWALEDLRDFKLIRYIYDDVAMAVGIVEELNLNTRIWGSTQPAQA